MKRNAKTSARADMEPMSHSTSIREEAALWAARLEGGGMGDSERSALTAWLEQSPEHLEELTRYRETSARVAPQLPAIFEAIELRQTVRRGRRLRRSVAWAAVGGIAATLMWVGSTLFSGHHFETAAAERRVVRLEDGSRVTLSARTDLRVKFTRGERRVVLSRGEAVFNVSKEPRPFFVQVEAGLIRVTGTVFDVHAQGSDAAEVTVVEGHVQLSSAAQPTQPRILDPDTRGRIMARDVTVDLLPPGTAEQSIAWQEGSIVFEDTRLADALRRFEDYHGWEIKVSPDAADLRLGGRFDLENVQEFLRALPRVLPVAVKQNGTHAEVTARPSARS